MPTTCAAIAKTPDGSEAGHEAVGAGERMLEPHERLEQGLLLLHPHQGHAEDRAEQDHGGHHAVRELNGFAGT